MEVIMVIGVLGVVSGMAVPLYRDYQIRNDLSLATEQVTQGLARARLLAQSGQNDSGWGFYIPAGILFKGATYADRDPNFDETYPMPSTITPSGLYEVSYSKLQGRPSATGAITLTALNREQRTIFIEVQLESVAVVQNDEFTICHYPPGNPGNANTMTVSESNWPAHRDNHGDTLGPCATETSSAASSAPASSTAASSVASVASSAASSAGGGTSCENRFSVASDGTITTTGPLSVTFSVLGSEITYGAGGPEINVYASRKKVTGNSYQDLFSGNDVDGGETQTVTGYVNGSQVIVKVRGYYKKNGWLTFDETYRSNDDTGHIVVLRDGDELPDYPAFDDQDEIEDYLADVLDAQNRINIGTYDLLLLTELGSLNSSAADFQDAVILLQFSDPSC